MIQNMIFLQALPMHRSVYSKLNVAESAISTVIIAENIESFDKGIVLYLAEFLYHVEKASDSWT